MLSDYYILLIQLKESETKFYFIFYDELFLRRFSFASPTTTTTTTIFHNQYLTFIMSILIYYTLRKGSPGSKLFMKLIYSYSVN